MNRTTVGCICLFMGTAAVVFFAIDLGNGSNSLHFLYDALTIGITVILQFLFSDYFYHASKKIDEKFHRNGIQTIFFMFAFIIATLIMYTHINHFSLDWLGIIFRAYVLGVAFFPNETYKPPKKKKPISASEKIKELLSKITHVWGPQALPAPIGK